MTFNFPASSGGASTFTGLTDVDADYSGKAGRVPIVNSDTDGLTLTPAPGQSLAFVAGDAVDGFGGSLLFATGAGAGEGNRAGDVVIATAYGDGNTPDTNGAVQISSGGHVGIAANGRLSLGVTDVLRINNVDAVVTQEVLVAGVCTMTFTHGILTSFTPA